MQWRRNVSLLRHLCHLHIIHQNVAGVIEHLNTTPNAQLLTRKPTKPKSENIKSRNKAKLGYTHFRLLSTLPPEADVAVSFFVVVAFRAVVAVAPIAFATVLMIPFLTLLLAGLVLTIVVPVLDSDVLLLELSRLGFFSRVAADLFPRIGGAAAAIAALLVVLVAWGAALVVRCRAGRAADGLLGDTGRASIDFGGDDAFTGDDGNVREL